MQIKIYRGTHQIGGCVTEIKTATARIIIDMGEELPSYIHAEQKPFEIDGVTHGTPDCNAVLITHYHGDHVGMFEKVLPHIPIYMGKVAKQIYGVIQNTLKAKLNKGNPQKVQDFNEYVIGKPLHYCRSFIISIDERYIRMQKICIRLWTKKAFFFWAERIMQPKPLSKLFPTVY